jgi:TP901 family phage tail tape measure protein
MAVYDVATRLVVQGVDTSSVQRAVSTINAQLDRGTASAKSFSDALALRGINLAGYTALGAVVLRVSSSISKATNDAIKFDYELAKIAQTVNRSNDDIRSHADSIRKISVAYGLSAPKIAETVRVLAQAGYSFKEAKASADSLAQTTLLSSFESISDTTDGLIAINKQFVSTIGQSARVLSVLNTVSKKYAVESSDLVEATRKAGGVFASTGGNLEELVSIFTTVRDTTRESAETVATGLRTIFGRLQRPKTIEYLRELGIELTDLKGNFIGNYQAIQAIQEGISRNKIAPNSLQFAAIVEQLGGIRQQSRVIPLLTQAAKMQRVYADAQSAASDTASDLAKAQDTLSFKLSQTQQNFSKFIGEISETESFKKMVDMMLSLANATLSFASSIKELIPLLAAFATVKLGVSLFKGLNNPAAAFGNIGQKRRFASGGFVPGSGSGDIVPAMLEPGEFVIRKSAAQAMGAEALHRINKYAQGGPVKGEDLGSAAIRKRVVSKRAQIDEFKTGQKINSEDKLSFNKIQMGIDGGKKGPKEFEKYAQSYLKKYK